MRSSDQVMCRYSPAFTETPLRKMKTVLLILAVFAAVLADKSDINRCTYTSDAGKVFDLSPLISKEDTAYMFTQTVLDTDDNVLTNPNFSNPVTRMFQVQICRNITKPMNENCTITAPAYMYDPVAKKCTAFGSVRVATFQPNPFNDGVYLDYYNGEAVSHIQRYEARVYFVCNPNKTRDGPTFEHFKKTEQALHIRVNTKYAC